MRPLIYAFLILSLTNACNSNTDQTIKVNGQIQQMITKVNSELPAMVDQFTRFDSMALGESKNINFYYALTGLNLDSIVANVDSISMKDFENAMTTALRENVVYNSEYQFYRENMATFNYIYYNKNGRILMQLNFEPEDYLN